MSGWRLAGLGAVCAVVLTPAALFVWLMRSIGNAIERMNP